MDPGQMTFPPGPEVDPRNPPGRRVGSLLLLRNQAGAVLMVKPSYGGGFWILPGGGAREGEHSWLAAAREGQKETGQLFTPGRILIVDYIPANAVTGSAEGYNFVFDGGRWPDGNPVTLPTALADGKPELTDFRFVPLDLLHTYAQPYQVRRVRAAVEAADNGTTAYLVEGRQPELPITVHDQHRDALTSEGSDEA